MDFSKSLQNYKENRGYRVFFPEIWDFHKKLM